MYYTIEIDKDTKEYYSNIKDALRNVILSGGELLDPHGRLIVQIPRKEDDTN